MIEKDLELAKTILLQDISAGKFLFDKDNFLYMNIVANRYLENCLIFEDYRLFLPGIFMKEMANDYNAIISHPDKSKKINSAKAIGEGLTLKIQEYFKDLNEESLWKAFYNYNLSINDFLRDDIDSNYLKNLPFSLKAFNFLLNYLENNLKYLYILDNRLLRGILTIIIRVIRNHSFSLDGIMVYIFIKSLDSLYQYLYYENLKNDQLDVENLKKELSIYVDYIKFLKEKKIDAVNFDKILWEMIKRWREMYILYKDIELLPKSLKEGMLVPLTLVKETKEDYKIKPLTEKNEL